MCCIRSSNRYFFATSRTMIEALVCNSHCRSYANITLVSINDTVNCCGSIKVITCVIIILSSLCKRCITSCTFLMERTVYGYKVMTKLGNSFTLGVITSCTTHYYGVTCCRASRILCFCIYVCNFVSESINCYSLSRKLFATNRTVNYVIILTCCGTCRINVVFNNSCSLGVSECFAVGKSTALTCLGLCTCCICPLLVVASLCNCLFYSTIYAGFTAIVFVVANSSTIRTCCLLTLDYESMTNCITLRIEYYCFRNKVCICTGRNNSAVYPVCGYAVCCRACACRCSPCIVRSGHTDKH